MHKESEIHKKKLENSINYKMMLIFQLNPISFICRCQCKAKINDLPGCNLFFKPRIYADDTTLTSAAKDTDILQIKMNSDLNKIQTWLKANKLTLNVIGTHSKLASL